MNINEIPLIITNYNQLTFTRNLVNWFKFYYPENPVWIVDNGSTDESLWIWYNKNGEVGYGATNTDWERAEFGLVMNKENDFINNLKKFIDEKRFEYYIISDPDISPHPTTPPNFLEYFKAVIDGGYHRCGFDLIYDDIPDWNPKKGWIQGDQKILHGEIIDVHGHQGFKAPIDTTFCLYSSKNGGWQAPMDGRNWGNCVRLFKAFHLTWYLDNNYLNEEMKHYFSTVLKRDNTKPSAGRNHFNPINGFE